MGELINFLRSEVEKKDYIIEELLLNAKHDSEGLDRADLITILQSALNIYGRVEGLRDFHRDWIFIPTNRYYDALRGLVSSGEIPKNSEEPFFTKEVKIGEAVGYLSVVHLFQIHSHAMPHHINQSSEIEEILYRVFSHADQDLKYRGMFLEKIRNELTTECAEDLVGGVSMAYGEFERILKRRKKTELPK
jgi:hypothetical protein